MNSENIKSIIRFTPETLSNRYSDLIFSIPIYQRLFAWESKQIKKLMDDLFDAFLENTGFYYLGILTLACREEGKLELIDGQQRMTVTVLMSIAFRELSEGRNLYWSSYLREGCRVIFSSRDEDTSYIKARANGTLLAHQNEMMEEGITTIKKWCANKFVTEDGGIDRLNFDRFVKYVWERLTLFCGHLPDRYIMNPVELNRYFEAMNSTGRQLQQHEILLVELINAHPKSETLSRVWNRIADIKQRYIPVNEDIESYRSDYRWRIRNFQTEFKKSDNSDEDFQTIEEIVPKKLDKTQISHNFGVHQMIISFEELLLMALKLTIGGEHNRDFYRTDLLLTRFEEANLRERGLIDSFFENLLICRLILDYKIVRQEITGDYDYNLLTPDKGSYLEKFQSMLNVAHSEAFYRWLPNYVEWLKENPDSSEFEELNKLKEIDRELHPIVPTLSELLYSRDNNTPDRYWFWRLDYELWANREDEDGWLNGHPELSTVVNRYVFRTNRSIEHLHPQTPTDELSEKWEGNDLNRFGNLAMISSSFNSLQSNESAGVKMERIHHQIETSQLQSLKMLHMWIMYRRATDFSQSETWTKDKVDIHEKAMMSYIEAISLEHAGYS